MSLVAAFEFSKDSDCFEIALSFLFVDHYKSFQVLCQHHAYLTMLPDVMVMGSIPFEL